METRIGSSCALTIPMAIGKVVETRQHLGDAKEYAKWKDVSKFAIDNKKYLILTPCTNASDGRHIIPEIPEWKNIIEQECIYLRSIGGNRFNCHISLINEGTIYFRNNGGAARWLQYINEATPIIKKYQLVSGAGNLEFYDSAVLGDWYGYLNEYGNFDILDIHIQGSCDNEERIKKYVMYAWELAKRKGRRLNCSEAFYGDIKNSGGWKLLNLQYYYAQQYNCENFCNVFNNLDYSAFPLNFHHVVDQWRRLAFVINGDFNKPNSSYWLNWQNIINDSGPEPNIKEEYMFQLEKFYYRLKVTYTRDISKAGIRFIQTVIGAIVDGKWGTQTDELLKAYQRENGLVDDAIVGPLTFRMMMKTNPDAYIDLQYFVAVGDW